MQAVSVEIILYQGFFEYVENEFDCKDQRGYSWRMTGLQNKTSLRLSLLRSGNHSNNREEQ